MVTKKTLDEICEDSPEFLKELVMHDSKYSDRLLVQTKCIEKYKFEESTRQKKDIGWEKAWELWVVNGYAGRFGDLYKEDMSFRQIYREVMK